MRLDLPPSPTSILGPQLYGSRGSETLQVLGCHGEDVVGVSEETVEGVVLLNYINILNVSRSMYE